jgi:Bardet-Biedl syndrome 1 protein
VQTYKNMPLVQQTVITCMTTLKKSREDFSAVSCLVVGTETGSVIVLDPTAGSILKKVFLSHLYLASPPSHGSFFV